MSANHLTKGELIACLAWQVACGADEALCNDATHDQAFVPIKSFLATPLNTTFASSAEENDKGKDKVNDGARKGKVWSIMQSVAEPSHPQSIPTQSITARSSPPLIEPVTDNLTAITSLNALRTALEKLEGCALKNTAGSLVFCDGNPGARVMIIGEAPGRDEDRVGLPFVGAAGQLLDKMLASIGLDRSTVYITNLLPWRPPGNRTPTAEETRLLLPYLRRHIQLAQPEYILILGGSSAKALLGTNDGILKLRGVWRDVDFGDGIMRLTLPSLHPAYLLRSPAQKRLSFDDLLSLRERLA